MAAGDHFLMEKTELQIQIHDSDKHPFREFSSKATPSEDFKFKVSASSLKGSFATIDFQLKELREECFQKSLQNDSGKSFRKGEFLVFTCQVLDVKDIEVRIEVVGIGVALFSCCLLTKHHETVSLPVVSEDGHVSKGIIQFDCLIITPWKNENFKSDQNIIPHWHPDSLPEKRCLEMGHRGCGTTHGKTRSNSTPIENTLASFDKAFKKGADYVELDVQLTKDLVPVVFHDFFTSVLVKQKDSGSTRKIRLAVNDVTFEELSNLEFTFIRDSYQEGVEATDKACEAEDNESEQLFPSLEQVLKESQPELGIFIEIKFPMQGKSGDWESDRHSDKTALVDRTLDVVYAHAGKRRIIFGSFDPAVCTMLRLKQHCYKVVLITCGENKKYPLCMDQRCRTLKMAQHFALSEDLLGISVMSDPLVDTLADVHKEVHSNSLELFTWGNANVNVDFIDLQKRLGISGVIYDGLHELKST